MKMFIEIYTGVYTHPHVIVQVEEKLFFFPLFSLLICSHYWSSTPLAVWLSVILFPCGSSPQILCAVLQFPAVTVFALETTERWACGLYLIHGFHAMDITTKDFHTHTHTLNKQCVLLKQSAQCLSQEGFFEHECPT